MQKLVATILLLCLFLASNAQDQRSYIKEGNTFFKAGQLEKAIDSYDKVTDEKYKYTALLNKGAALYNQKQYDNAIKVYQQVNQSKQADAEQRSEAYYNEGAVYSIQKKLQESIEAYKNALRLNSKDIQARENLQKALSEQKKSGGGGGGEQKPQPSQSKLNNNQVEQQLKRLEQKEKTTKNKLDGKKTQVGSSVGKDW